MKTKVKKYAGGMLTDSSGNPVRSGSGEPVRTRSADEIAEDNKRPFGSYATKSPKPSIAEDRPMAGADDYASMGKRAGATSTWSGEDMSPRLRASKEETEEAPTGIASGFKSGESKFERNDNEVKMPAVKKKITPKAESKRGSQSFPLKDEGRGSQSFPIGEGSKTLPGKPSDKEEKPQNLPGKADAKKEYYRDFSGKIKEKTPDTSSFKNFKDMISEGAGALGKGISNYASTIKSPAQRRDEEKASKEKGFAKGGKVSTASSRGDGIAQRGKTKGRIC